MWGLKGNLRVEASLCPLIRPLYIRSHLCLGWIPLLCHLAFKAVGLLSLKILVPASGSVLSARRGTRPLVGIFLGIGTLGPTFICLCHR